MPKRKYSNLSEFSYDYNLETESDENKDNDDSTEVTEVKKSKSEDYYNEGLSDKADVTSYKNHIYFYCSVTKKSCLKLNMQLREIAQRIIDNGANHLNKDRYIYLHINSFGGSVFAALSTIDTIKNLKIPVVSIIEGGAASAATMISVVCSHRIILKNSYMLIHQLSSGCWGKMNQLEDEMENLKKLMNRIKLIYKEHAKIDDEQLDNILKHDLWWDSKKCKSEGLVDEIREKTNHIYPFDKKKIDL
tara:strand:+ start:75 stop:815 length:741 start_codon:yes stop_codon:yes gene_type:complete